MKNQNLNYVAENINDLLFLEEEDFTQDVLGVSSKGCTLCSHTCSGGTKIEI